MKKLLFCVGISLLLIVPVFAEDSTKTDKKEKPKTSETEKKDAEMTSKKIADTTKKEPEWIKTESGLQYREKVVGEGEEAVDSMKVKCHYTLWLSNKEGLKGKRIQSSKDFGKPFQCQIGVRLIEGWSEGMIGMKEGGVRELIIPPDIGYGARGGGGGLIPANATLYFEIEFLERIK